MGTDRRHRSEYNNSPSLLPFYYYCNNNEGRTDKKTKSRQFFFVLKIYYLFLNLHITLDLSNLLKCKLNLKVAGLKLSSVNINL
jgi:hypothetical protein